MTAATVGFSSCKDEDSEPGPSGDPSLALTAGEVSDVTIKFTIVPENAQKVAYMVLEEGAEVPDAKTIMSSGKKGTATKERTYTEQGLTAQTTYVVVAAASNGEKFSEVEQITMTTSEKVYVPTVELKAGTPDMERLTFAVKATDADKAAYVCVKKGETIPDAAGILKEGKSVEATGEEVEVTVENLSAATEYVIAAAASYGETLSVVKQISMTTTDAPAPELTDLFGTWNAKMKVYGVSGTQIDFNKTVDVTFNVVINEGVNDWTKNLYSQYKVVACQGFMDFDTYSIDNLISAGLSQDEANMYWGPKWFLAVNAGKVVVSSEVNLCEQAGNDTFCSGVVKRLSDSKFVVNYIVPVGESKVSPTSDFPVEVSSDKNTIVVKPVSFEGQTGYPSFCFLDNDGWAPWGLNSVAGCSYGASEITLTRTGSSVAPLALPSTGIQPGSLLVTETVNLYNNAMSNTVAR